MIIHYLRIKYICISAITLFLINFIYFIFFGNVLSTVFFLKLSPLILILCITFYIVDVAFSNWLVVNYFVDSCLQYEGINLVERYINNESLDSYIDNKINKTSFSLFKKKFSDCDEHEKKIVKNNTAYDLLGLKFKNSYGISVDHKFTRDVDSIGMRNAFIIHHISGAIVALLYYEYAWNNAIWKSILMNLTIYLHT